MRFVGAESQGRKETHEKCGSEGSAWQAELRGWEPTQLTALVWFRSPGQQQGCRPGLGPMELTGMELQPPLQQSRPQCQHLHCPFSAVPQPEATKFLPSTLRRTKAHREHISWAPRNEKNPSGLWAKPSSC